MSAFFKELHVNKAKKKTVLLFGGSFNPILPQSHIRLAKETYLALNKGGLGVDEVWLLPAIQNPQKSEEEMADFKDRVSMCRMEALSHNNWLKVSAFELDCKSTGETSEVISKLIEAYSNTQFIWLMGADNAAYFHTWNSWETILNMVPIVVVGDFKSIDYASNGVALSKYHHSVQPVNLLSQTLPNIRILELDFLAEAPRASLVRSGIRKGYDVSDAVSLNVLNYIKTNNLYR